MEGGRVRILSVTSGCGCAVPKFEPTSIEPEKSGVLEVDAKPPEMGEKTVEFALETDSKLTPTVTLHLRLIGMRRPPFLLRVQGDLAYL